MELLYAFYCDFARQAEGGKLDAFGIWEILTMESDPGSLPLFFVVAKIRLTDKEQNGATLPVALTVTDPNKQEVASIAGMATIQRHVDDVPCALSVLFQIPGMPVLLAGEYPVQIDVGTESFRATSIFVRKK